MGYQRRRKRGGGTRYMASMGTRVERYFVDSERLVMTVICQIIQVKVDEYKKVTN